MATDIDTEQKETPDSAPSVAPKRRSTKIGRWQIGVNVLIQVALVVLLAAMVNALAFRHYKRWDHSRDQKYALSDKTKRFLDTIHIYRVGNRIHGESGHGIAAGRRERRRRPIRQPLLLADAIAQPRR